MIITLNFAHNIIKIMLNGLKFIMTPHDFYENEFVIRRQSWKFHNDTRRAKIETLYVVVITKHVIDSNK